MKIIVMCEECGNSAELVPTDNGQHAYVQNQFRGRFYIDDHNVEIEATPSLSLNEGFVTELTDASDYEEVVQLLENEIENNISIDTKLNEFRIDCRNCNHNSYIVLTALN
jgi:hypothetical protein